jgi:tetratricopeptide (TPR) repeat protein
LGEYDTARTHCQAALTLCRDHYPEGEAGTLDSLGYIAHHTGHHQQALGYYQQALILFRSVGYTSEVAATLDNLGHPHVALGEYEHARVVWLEALQLYQEQGGEDAYRVQQQLDDLDNRAGTADLRVGAHGEGQLQQTNSLISRAQPHDRVTPIPPCP